MKSIGAMVKQIEGMLDTGDLSKWEQGFVENLVVRTHHGKMTGNLTEKQVEIIERIYRQHFGDAEPA